MKFASVCSAGEVSVRPCFLVKMRKASGRNETGGSRMGSTDGFTGSGGLRVQTGYTGVANAGEDDGMASADASGAAG